MILQGFGKGEGDSVGIGDGEVRELLSHSDASLRGGGSEAKRQGEREGQKDCNQFLHVFLFPFLGISQHISDRPEEMLTNRLHIHIRRGFARWQ